MFLLVVAFLPVLYTNFLCDADFPRSLRSFLAMCVSVVRKGSVLRNGNTSGCFKT